MSSGRNVAISGTTVGYYLGKRCEANRARDLGQPSARVGSGVGIEQVPVRDDGATFAELWAKAEDANRSQADVRPAEQ
jgi:hypothetical protein